MCTNDNNTYLVHDHQLKQFILELAKQKLIKGFFVFAAIYALQNLISYSIFEGCIIPNDLKLWLSVLFVNKLKTNQQTVKIAVFFERNDKTLIITN